MPSNNYICHKLKTNGTTQVNQNESGDSRAVQW